MPWGNSTIFINGQQFTGGTGRCALLTAVCAAYVKMAGNSTPAPTHCACPTSKTSNTHTPTATAAATGKANDAATSSRHAHHVAELHVPAGT